MGRLNLARVPARDLPNYAGRRLLVTDGNDNILACAWRDYRLDEAASRVTVHIIDWQRWFPVSDYHFAADELVDVLLDGPAR
ncbi:MULTISPECIES: hypothetical protein [Antrihabitans]|uniref:Uncharacterized protein n=1 Tax=Antrihabitans stalagmiti TaxID=2799499 RepID=A0A934NWS5_9NOCA|nr:MULTISPECIES: hypothetical protein [Antrihabitans]MBJ8343016.1 hypothetical protein [Antrihabitans stalagmiti]MBJ8344475.1 hypothetical protein [Antrihabitans sp. YC2-6]